MLTRVDLCLKLHFFVYLKAPVLQQQLRYLNLLEFQSKDLLQKYGVAIQQFKVLDNSKDDTQAVQSFGNQAKTN